MFAYRVVVGVCCVIAAALLFCVALLCCKCCRSSEDRHKTKADKQYHEYEA